TSGIRGGLWRTPIGDFEFRCHLAIDSGRLSSPLKIKVSPVEIRPSAPWPVQVRLTGLKRPSADALADQRQAGTDRYGRGDRREIAMDHRGSPMSAWMPSSWASPSSSQA